MPDGNKFEKGDKVVLGPLSMDEEPDRSYYAVGEVAESSDVGSVDVTRDSGDVEGFDLDSVWHPEDFVDVVERKKIARVARSPREARAMLRVARWMIGKVVKNLGGWAREQYERDVVPRGWYVHGRSGRKDLDTRYVIQVTQDWRVAERYAGRRGSMWMIKPKGNVMDLRGEHTRDMDAVVQRAIREYEDGDLPFGEDIERSLGVKELTDEQLGDTIRDMFSPPDIVSSAYAYDDPEWAGWLWDRFEPDFVKTPDGGVLFDRGASTLVRVDPEGIAASVRGRRRAAVRLYHTTSLSGLGKILSSLTLKPGRGHDFVSLSEKPLTGDIEANDATIVFDASKMRGVMPVEYSESWYDRYPEQASYVAGEGWGEQFVIPDECYDEEGWEDDDCVDEAYREAELESFLWKSDEKEWIGKRSGPVKFGKDAVLAVMPARASADRVRGALQKEGIDWVGVVKKASAGNGLPPRAPRVARRVEFSPAYAKRLRKKFLADLLALEKGYKSKWLALIEDLAARLPEGSQISRYLSDREYIAAYRALHDEYERYLRKMREIYELVFYEEILSDHMADLTQGGTGLGFAFEDLQKDAWDMLYSMHLESLEVDEADPADAEAKVHRAFERIRRRARKVWDDVLWVVERMEDDVKDFGEPTRVGAFTVVPAGGVTEEVMERAVSLVRRGVKMIAKAGFRRVISDPMVVEVDARSQQLGTAEYQIREDKVVLRPLGTFGVETFVHEMGHRFYYRQLSPGKRNAWRRAYDGDVFRISAQDIENMLNLIDWRDDPSFLDVKAAIKEYARKYRANPLTEHKVRVFMDNRTSWGHVERRKLKGFWDEYLLDQPFMRNQISDYGDTNAREAFAEIFMLIVTGKRVNPQAAYWFREVVGE